MPDVKMRDALAELRARLDAGGPLDEEEIALLFDLHDRIERALEQTGEAGPIERAAARDEADSSARSFAARYPQLAAALERVAETLSGLGL
jgi:hypothetical protein